MTKPWLWIIELITEQWRKGYQEEGTDSATVVKTLEAVGHSSYASVP